MVEIIKIGSSALDVALRRSLVGGTAGQSVGDKSN